MSKGAKVYGFQTEAGERIKITRGDQDKAVARLAELVNNMADWTLIFVKKIK